ncbi:MAG: multiheme c-type cytochrome [Nannocystaceae bacterium]
MPRRSLAASLAALALACGEPSPAVDHEAARALPTELECAACHVEVAAEWARSRHHASFTNVDFQRAYAREPLPFCRECHAPERAALPALEAEALGVGCLSCHRDGDGLVTAGAGPTAAPHPLRRDPGFATRACARCHEFDFPAHADAGAGAMMQATLREHRASPFADRSCADCHMPRGGHDFGSTRDPEAMRRALEVEARREAGALVLDLRPRGVGHAFPTGDLFRRLAVHATLVGPDGRAGAHEVRYLERRFVPRHHPDGRLSHEGAEPLVDARLVGPTTLQIELPLEPAVDLVWWVDLERVDHRDAEAPERSTIAGTIRLAEGRIPP